MAPYAAGSLGGVLAIHFALSVIAPAWMSTHEQAFVREQQSRCFAFGGQGTYDAPAHKYECWGKATMRKSRLIYREFYRGM